MSSKKELEKIEMLREAFNSYIHEAGDELNMGAAPMPAAPQAAAPQQGGPQTPNPDVTMDPMQQGAQPAAAEYTIQQFVSSLNKIRGGRSFDDQDVYQQVNTLFAGLDPVTKESLRNVIGQLESIVTPVQQNQQSPDGSLPSVQDTQAYNQASASPAGAGSPPPAVPGEAPPA